MADKQVVQVLDGFDNKAQADRIAALIMPGETLYLVFDCKGRGSGFIGVTDKRIIARDDGHRNKSIDRKSTRLNSSHIQKSRMPSSA